LGSGIAVAKNKHIALEFLVELFPKKIGEKVLIFSDFVSISFLFIIFYQAIVLIGKTKGSLIGASPIPVSGYYVIVAFGSLMMILNYINHIIKKLCNMGNREGE
jgi:TRAP-type C4-dicarboxylate transport system permease small subunit